jgi:hypothetical protein
MSWRKNENLWEDLHRGLKTVQTERSSSCGWMCRPIHGVGEARVG